MNVRIHERKKNWGAMIHSSKESRQQRGGQIRKVKGGRGGISSFYALKWNGDEVFFMHAE